MADLSNPLTQVAVGQAQPAVTVNNLVDALSPAACFGQNDLTTSGLTWGYYGGRFGGIGINAGTVALPASQATIYIVANKSTGVVSQSTTITNWNDTTNYQRLYIATTGPTTITDWDDYREFISSSAIGTAAWGAISGTLSNQSDLQSALDAKVAQGTFEEQVQDIVGALITAGTNVTKQYNDGDSPATLVISSTATASSLTQEDVEDICAALITAGSNVTKQYNDGDSPATLVLSSTAPTPLTQEEVEDICAALITAGTNITKQYNDGDSPATLVLSASAARSPVIQSVASSATVTPTFSDDIVLITAQAAGLTLNNPTGTAIDGLGIVIRIKDNGTARSIAYGTQYRAIGVTLPATTVVSKTLYLAMIFNNTDTKWDVLAVGQEA